MPATLPKRTGITHLSLHYGKAPPWLSHPMVKLAGEITIASIELLAKALNKAKLGIGEKKEALNRLNRAMMV